MVINRNPEYFLTIAREKSISRAAEKLYISQSSLSQYIAKLEDALEVKLFDRSGTPFSLLKRDVFTRVIWRATTICIRNSSPTCVV